MSFSSELDVHEELSGAAVGRSNRLLGLLITLITMFDGYDTFNPAYVIHYVMQPWGLVPSRRVCSSVPDSSASWSLRSVMA